MLAPTIAPLSLATPFAHTEHMWYTRNADGSSCGWEISAVSARSCTVHPL